ncbi:MAG TPA: GNAT family N-acetyltransferase [Gemmatimonadota bacterium]|nr:GNAT family N-acetyltransferase [Gemmatimonadota bacterium]
MKIAYLADHPEHIPQLAGWLHAQWGYLHENDSVERRAARLESRATRGGIPVTFVAVDGVILLGSASLVDDDLETRPELTPWLASVYVAPEHRGKGVGSALVQRVVEEARDSGVSRLYLWTTDQERLYARLGWIPVERMRFQDEDIVVMTIEP